MPVLALRCCFLFGVLIYSLFFFWPVSVVEPTFPDNVNTELIQVEQDLLILSQGMAIHIFRPITYLFLIHAGTSIISLHLGGHAPPFAGFRVHRKIKTVGSKENALVY